MKPYPNPLRTAVAALSFAVVLAIAAGSAPAAVLGPYTADANTLLLYHFDETSGAIVNYGSNPTSTYNLTDTGGVNGRDGLAANGGGYGEAAYTGFGSAFNIYKSGTGGYNGSTTATGGGVRTGNTFLQGTLQSGTGELTYEALIKLDTTSGEHQILSRDDTVNGRGFVFMVLNGSLIIVREGGGGSVSAAIPNTGDNVFSADAWYHVAITYSGADGVSGNTKLYWTRVSELATEASLIGTGTLSADMAGGLHDLMIGSSNRSPFRFQTQAVDEVRVSNVVRGAGDFIFGEIVVPSPAALPAGLAMLGLAAASRRRR